MEQYLIDTNTVSDYFSASFSDKSLAFLDTIIDSKPNLSVITQIELLCWKTEPVIEQYIIDFIKDSNIYNVDSDVIERCVMLRRKKKIKMPDAIIAATALAYGFIIVTNNEKDFSNIKGLKLINPYKI